jgi:ABC-type multidrug transport system fused ATPase/permease subunit
MELKAYGKAGAVAEEVFSSIRTVLSYNGQKREEQRFDLNKKYFLFLLLMYNNIYVLYRYEQHLGEAKRSGIKKGAINGFTMGLVWFLIYCSYSLGI